MKHVLINTVLTLVLALLAYLPFSVYKFENIKDIASNEKVLSATSDSFGRYVSFGEKRKVYTYETVVFKVFNDKQVEYTDFYTVSNSSNSIKEYEVISVDSDYLNGFKLVFTANQSNNIFIKPNQTVGLSLTFEPSTSNNATLSFIVLEKALYPEGYKIN